MNDAPTLDLDEADGATIVNFATMFGTGGSAVALAGVPVVTDVEDALTSLKVTLTRADGQPLDPAESIDTSGLVGWTATPGAGGVVTLTPDAGPATAAMVQAAISALRYVNTEPGDFTFDATDRQVTITVQDSEGLPVATASAVVQIAVSAEVTDTTGEDMFTGGAHGDTIRTLGGSDTVDGGAGDDTIELQLGGTDSVDGGADNDTLDVVADPESAAVINMTVDSGALTISTARPKASPPSSMSSRSP